MRHQDLENDAQHELRRIVRSIDKRLQYQVQDGPSGQDPFLTLTLSHGTPAQVAMELSVEELRRALENDRDRYVLRERIKRAKERLWFRSPRERFFSTKAIRPGSESFANFRSGRR
jgi:hypothetical protein